LGVLAYALHALGQALNEKGQAEAAERSFQEAAEIANACKMLPLLEEMRRQKQSLE